MVGVYQHLENSALFRAQCVKFNQLYKTTEKSIGIFTAGSYVGALQLSK